MTKKVVATTKNKNNKGMTVIAGEMVAFSWEKEQGKRVAGVSIEDRKYVYKGVIFKLNKDDMKSFNSINDQINKLKSKQEELLTKLRKVFPDEE